MAAARRKQKVTSRAAIEREYRKAPRKNTEEYIAGRKASTIASPINSLKRMKVIGIAIATNEITPRYFSLPSLHLSASTSLICGAEAKVR